MLSIDWSSDVLSSDLHRGPLGGALGPLRLGRGLRHRAAGAALGHLLLGGAPAGGISRLDLLQSRVLCRRWFSGRLYRAGGDLAGAGRRPARRAEPGPGAGRMAALRDGLQDPAVTSFGGSRATMHP